MEEMIKEINDIMGIHNMGSQLTISFYSDNGIVFGIYEQEIPLVVDTKKGTVHLDCETTSSHLTPDMLTELAEIAKVIQNNMTLILKCV